MSRISLAPDGRPVALGDLAAEEFPVTITAFVDGEQMWERVVEPYVLVDIPAPRPEHQGRVRVRVRYATGEEFWQEPMTPEEADAHIERKLREGK